MEHLQNDLEGIIALAIKGDRVSISIKPYETSKLEIDVNNYKCFGDNFQFILEDNKGDLFEQLQERFSEGFTSLRSVRVEKNNGANGFTTINSQRKRFSFSSLEDCFEFFINAEKCFKVLQIAALDAKKRCRHDLEIRFLGELSQIVQISDFSKG